MNARRKAFLESLPYVKYLVKAQPCTGFMNKTTLKHLYGTAEQRAQKPRCKVPAHWKFTALKKSWAKDGVFCPSHLFSRGLYSDMDEMARTEKYVEKFVATEKEKEKTA